MYIVDTEQILVELNLEKSLPFNSFTWYAVRHDGVMFEVIE